MLFLSPDADPDVEPTSATDRQFLHRIFPVAVHSSVVVAVSEPASELGIQPGMPLAEVRGILPSQGQTPVAEIRFHAWSAAVDRQALADLAEELHKYAPVIGIDDQPVPDCLLLDITGCGPLFGGESSLAERLLRHIRVAGFHPRVAISESVASAWALVHTDGFIQMLHRSSRRQQETTRKIEWDLPVTIIPSGQAYTSLQSLPLEAGRLSPDDTDLLRQLGVTTLGRLLQLPLDDLPSRLSRGALSRIRQLRGDHDELITPLPERIPVAAAWTAENPVTTVQTLRQVQRHLCEKISEQLSRRHIGATRLECQLLTETGGIILLNTDFVRPVQSAGQLTELLGLRLESVTINRPIVKVTVCASITPVPPACQRDLFDSREHLSPQEELATLINRLSNRLDHSAAATVEATEDVRPEFTFRLRPLLGDDGQDLRDRIHRLVTSETSPIPSLCFHRPVRLLTTPEAVTAVDESLLTSGFVLRGRRENVSGVVGPERLQTGWWEDVGASRDYYRITTRSGSRYWMYQELRTRHWFLHGVFD